MKQLTEKEFKSTLIENMGCAADMGIGIMCPSGKPGSRGGFGEWFL